MSVMPRLRHPALENAPNPLRVRRGKITKWSPALKEAEPYSCWADGCKEVCQGLSVSQGGGDGPNKVGSVLAEAFALCLESATSVLANDYTGGKK